MGGIAKTLSTRLDLWAVEDVNDLTVIDEMDFDERVCQDDFCKFSKFKYLSAEKSPNISCLHIS